MKNLKEMIGQICAAALFALFLIIAVFVTAETIKIIEEMIG